MKRIDRETLERRLQLLVGSEELLAWGWAVLGMRNVFIGATPTRLVLETITFGLETRSVEFLEYSRLEAVSAGAGDSSLPGWAKFNVENLVMSAMTTHLLVKSSGEKPRHYLFRYMPLYKDNKSAGLEIGRVVSEACPGLPTELDLKAVRRQAGDTRHPLRWGFALGAASALLCGILSKNTGGWIAGAFAGFLIGALSGLLWNFIRVSATGRG